MTLSWNVQRREDRRGAEVAHEPSPAEAAPWVKGSRSRPVGTRANRAKARGLGVRALMVAQAKPVRRRRPYTRARGPENGPCHSLDRRQQTMASISNRARRRRAQWRSSISRAEQSPLSIAKFCRLSGGVDQPGELLRLAEAIGAGGAARWLGLTMPTPMVQSRRSEEGLGLEGP